MGNIRKFVFQDEQDLMSSSPVRENSLSAGSLDSGIKSIGLLEEDIREMPTLFLSAKRWLSVISGIILLSLLIVLACLTFGAQPIGMGVVMQTLVAGVRDGQAGIESAGVPGVIVWQVRLPRILLAFLVGGSLAGVGVALQALLRNPLAEPFVLGISSGAAFGATLAMLLGVGNTFLGVSTLPLWAFAGGLLAIMVVYRISVAYRMLWGAPPRNAKALKIDAPMMKYITTNPRVRSPATKPSVVFEARRPDSSPTASDRPSTRSRLLCAVMLKGRAHGALVRISSLIGWPKPVLSTQQRPG